MVDANPGPGRKEKVASEGNTRTSRPLTLPYLPQPDCTGCGDVFHPSPPCRLFCPLADQQPDQSHLEAWEKCRFSGPTFHPSNRNLYFNKLPGDSQAPYSLGASALSTAWMALLKPTPTMSIST